MHSIQGPQPNTKILKSKSRLFQPKFIYSMFGTKSSCHLRFFQNAMVLAWLSAGHPLVEEVPIAGSMVQTAPHVSVGLVAVPTISPAKGNFACNKNIIGLRVGLYFSRAITNFFCHFPRMNVYAFTNQLRVC